ncbi:biliverdin-producing heme oxygenase [Xanthomonas sacchari]|uniref:biliverdin-producing heme oxygenase n=1 Tax=Xanthomonas TaxID=338 RepID=UPI00224E2385|nr:biliverdin-producing heme oxygenase [Xanthomonas sacchari]MCW0401898.1 Heme oxygenase PigA [Xanthomonas sacchari]MCW0438430.1 Heme oxygenase PigA [Xanthomonas sacchari]
MTHTPSPPVIAPSPAPSRAQRLKAATAQAHTRLDRRIMAAQPFASRDNYARFLQVQYRFHCDMERIYANPVLASVVPDLAQRRRLPALVADLHDLGVALPADHATAPGSAGHPTQVAALGWLYVAEGSNLGAAILARLAAKLGLHAQFGARHLAGHEDGRAQQWRQFVAALDRLALDAGQEQAVIAAARSAFAQVQAYVDLHLPATPR